MKIDLLKLFIKSTILFVLALVIADKFLGYTGVPPAFRKKTTLRIFRLMFP
ncbi:hypothetical protein [Bacillus cereus]|uniref:hypothetical protein n=1 Tax=Bacillus cereus TaxID=1396 RepID=UPI00240697CE|nr:hypothetical protein [Bacillus cereus]MDF9552177.1 hypothetical protein [Bacillus cereus]